MYAVIESGGKQHRVEAGEVLRLEKLDASEGETINFDKVMMIGEGENIQIGTPFVEKKSQSSRCVVESTTEGRQVIVSPSLKLKSKKLVEVIRDGA